MAEVKMSFYDMVKSDEFNKATINWYKYPHEDPGKAFMKYLGIFSYNVQEDIVYMEAEAVAKLRLLSGPYHHTIIKAWYARMEPTSEGR